MGTRYKETILGLIYGKNPKVLSLHIVKDGLILIYCRNWRHQKAESVQALTKVWDSYDWTKGFYPISHRASQLVNEYDMESKGC